jgi:peptide/nickel transport system substrate-binding protein
MKPSADDRTQHRRIPAANGLAAALLSLTLALGAGCSPGYEEAAPPEAEPFDAPRAAATATPGEPTPAPIAVDPGPGPEGVPPGAMIVAGITPGAKGGRLLVGIAGDPKTFNPTIVDDVPSQTVSSYLFESLYQFDNVTQAETPGASTRWDYDEETREWTFHLREGMKWSDGAPLTSDDFLFFTEAAFHPTVPNSEREMLQVNGKRFEFSAPDPLTFVAKIPEVDSFAFMGLGLIRTLPRHKHGRALEEGRLALTMGSNSPPGEIVSSGPFMLKQFSSGERVVLAANPHHFRFDSRGARLPYIDELILLNVPDYNAMALRFQNGDLDYFDDPIQPQNLPLMLDGQEKGDYTVYDLGAGLNTYMYWFNLKGGGTYTNAAGERVQWKPTRWDAEPPAEVAAGGYRPFVDPKRMRWFQNVDFRRACSMATNRQEIVDTIMFGQGAPLYGLVSAANKVWHHPDIPKFPYDPVEAAELLDSIGYTDRNGDGLREDPDGNTIRFSLITNRENNVREKIGILLKEDLRALGLDVQFELLDFNNIITRTSDTYDYEACLLGLGSGVPPHPSMSTAVIKSSGRTHLWNPEQSEPHTPWEAEADELYEQMRKTFDLLEQQLIYARINAIFAEQQAAIYVVAPSFQVAARNKIGNVKPSILRPHTTHNINVHYIK